MKEVWILACPAILILIGMSVWSPLPFPIRGDHAMLGASATAREEKTIPVGHGPTLVIESDAGSIDLTGSANGEVRISAVKKANTQSELKDLHFSADERENIVYVTYRRPGGFEDAGHIDFQIEAPRDTVLYVRTGGGNITATGFASGMTADTAAGNIRATDLAGRVLITTGGGNIDTRTLTGRALLRTGGGNIEARSLDGAITAQSSTGNVSVDGRLTGCSQLMTGTGNIRAALPADSALSIQAATRMGQIREDFGLKVATAPVGGPDYLNGQLGDGSDRLVVHTAYGNVLLEKVCG